MSKIAERLLNAIIDGIFGIGSIIEHLKSLPVQIKLISMIVSRSLSSFSIDKYQLYEYNFNWKNDNIDLREMC